MAALLSAFRTTSLIGRTPAGTARTAPTRIGIEKVGRVRDACAYVWGMTHALNAVCGFSCLQLASGVSLAQEIAGAAAQD